MIHIQQELSCIPLFDVLIHRRDEVAFLDEFVTIFQNFVKKAQVIQVFFVIELLSDIKFNCTRFIHT